MIKAGTIPKTIERQNSAAGLPRRRIARRTRALISEWRTPMLAHSSGRAEPRTEAEIRDWLTRAVVATAGLDSQARSTFAVRSANTGSIPPRPFRWPSRWRRGWAGRFRRLWYGTIPLSSCSPPPGQHLAAEPIQVASAQLAEFRRTAGSDRHGLPVPRRRHRPTPFGSFCVRATRDHEYPWRPQALGRAAVAAGADRGPVGAAFLKVSISSIRTFSASLRAKRLTWIRSSGCCWKSRGKRSRSPVKRRRNWRERAPAYSSASATPTTRREQTAPAVTAARHV